MSTAMSAASYFCGVVFIGMLFWTLFALHLSRTKMDLLLSLLNNSSAVRERVIFKYFGIWGELVLIGGIAGIITFPSRFLKNGGISNEELASIPLPTKKKLAILSWTNFILMISLICAVSITEIIKFYDI